MSVLTEINEIYPELYEQEKKVADCILKNYQMVEDMSVMELAQKSDVSDATVMRFCKKARGCLCGLSIQPMRDKDDCKCHAGNANQFSFLHDRK